MQKMHDHVQSLASTPVLHVKLNSLTPDPKPALKTSQTLHATFLCIGHSCVYSPLQCAAAQPLQPLWLTASWPLALQPLWWPAGGTSHDTGCAPHNVIIVIWALMDFHYCIQAYSIMARDLNINAALCEFHLHKNSILDVGLCPGKANKPINNWHILKLELMQSIVPSILRAGVSI